MQYLKKWMIETVPVHLTNKLQPLKSKMVFLRGDLLHADDNAHPCYVCFKLGTHNWLDMRRLGRVN